MKRIGVLGGGESGVGAAVLAKKNGYEVILSDLNKIKEQYKKVLSRHDIQWEEEKHSEDVLLSCHEIVKSPGIPNHAPLINKLVAKGIPVISEIEFAFRFCNSKIIAITGSNGKTTTTTLVYHILKNAGLDVALGGNIGKSFALQLAESEPDYFVLELSSFQLDGIATFKPNIAILLNISPDHLDRYEYDMQKYVESKMRIAMNMGTEDTLIYNADDHWISQELEKNNTHATLKAITLKNQGSTALTGAYINENELVININEPLTMSIHELALQGKHNLFNSMAAGVAGRILEIRKEIVRDSLMNFDSIEHRLEFVAKVHGITFINDSKATNVNSTWYALESQDKPIIWIAGGVDKGNDYTELDAMVAGKVTAIICLGTDNKKLHDAFGSKVEQMYDVESAEDAVRLAYDLGHPGDVVLLSPACASFDLFENYEDRGQQFKAAVKSL